MRSIQSSRKRYWGLLLWFGVFGAMFWSGNAIAMMPMEQPAIISLSVAGTHLVFNANFPPGVERAILEMRPDLSASWQQAASLDVHADGGMVEFIIPKPALDTAFFRLNATMHAVASAQATAQLSAELQYVTVPPVGPVIATNAALTAEAVFHFKGVVDGSDRIIITHKGAFWEHVNWDWPTGPVTVNGLEWNPSQKNYMTTTGRVAFLPEVYSLRVVTLETTQGRDVSALERTNDALIVYLDDTPPGGAPYEFKIHFHPVAAEPPTPRMSTPATLKIAAQIDGSDLLKITAQEAIWTHRAYSYPAAVRLNDITWNVRHTNTLMNVGNSVFLPAGVNFSTAKIVQRKGRDLATMWADEDAVWISFADNPNGADAYELELSFGR